MIMVRLISPQGVPVLVTEEKAQRLLGQGFTRSGTPVADKPAPVKRTRRPASRK